MMLLWYLFPFSDWFHNIHFTIPSICIILCKNTYINKEVWRELKKITEAIMELMTIIKNPFEEDKGKSWKGRKSEFSRKRGKGNLHKWMIFCTRFLVLHFLLILAEHLPLKGEALDGWSWQQWTHKWILTYGECSNKNRWRHLRH